jgi:hypothetical protein
MNFSPIRQQVLELLSSASGTIHYTLVSWHKPLEPRPSVNFIALEQPYNDLSQCLHRMLAVLMHFATHCSQIIQRRKSSGTRIRISLAQLISNHITTLLMQEGVKELLRQHGMDLNLLPCCVVSQTCLAVDAREPLELINSLQKLLGTWRLQQVCTFSCFTSCEPPGLARALSDGKHYFLILNER